MCIQPGECSSIIYTLKSNRINDRKRIRRERGKGHIWRGGGEVHAWVRSLEFTKNRISADSVD